VAAVSGPFQPGRVYLGWQYAPVQADPGPPPRRPVPPELEQLNPGWLAAQRREERLLTRPWQALAGGCCAAVAAVLALGQAAVLNPPLTALGAGALAAAAALGVRAIWRGRRELRATIEAEGRRVAAARDAQEDQLFALQEDHARRFRAWQSQQQAFTRQPHWYPVTLPEQIDRVDVAGGTLAGWSALLTVAATSRLATGGEITVLDLSQGAVAGDLVALAQDMGIAPLVWVLPGDLPRLDLGVGMPAGLLADVLATSVAADPPGGSGAGGHGWPDPARDHTIVERVLGVLGEGAGIAQVMAGLRALGQVGDPREDIGLGLLTAAQHERITSLFGRGATDRVVIERAWAMEARLRILEPLGSDPVALPRRSLRVIALDHHESAFGSATLGTFATASMTHLLRQAPGGRPWQHTLCLAGAEKLSGDVLDRLCDACEITRTGLIVAYRSIPAHVRERLGRGNAAVAFMRLGNGEDAKIASEQIGTERRFELSQLTETVGTSVTGTGGWSYTSTVGTADSLSLSASVSQTSGRSHGRGHTRSDPAPFGQRTGSGSQEVSRSSGTSESQSITEGINASTSWGLNTSTAVGANESLARTAQRSREFLVEPHELQQLPPSAVIISYAAREGRQVVLADANPGILALPGVSTVTLEQARQAGAQPGAVFPAQAARTGAAPPWPKAPPGAPAPHPAAPAGVRGQVPPGTWGDGETGGASGNAADTDAGNWAGAHIRSRPAAGAASAPGAAPGTHDLASARDPAQAPVSWREGANRPPANLGPPPEPLDWRKRRRRR
jgi:hypothetical protein